jgi:uncharacterized protein
MKRNIIKDLIAWKNRNRKPLILKGARQVGKSYIIRYFGEEYFDNIVEINLEKETGIVELFQNRSIKEGIKLLELKKDIKITYGKTLLFFDEIQSSPELFPLLRYFYEEIPNLHIISAGSLLEFLLERHKFSMPVGRIEYMYLGPMLFDEFLEGIGKNRLINYLKNFTFKENMPNEIHQTLIEFYKRYIYLGGMPEVIENYANDKSYRNIEIIKQSIIQTYQDDFVKYKDRIDYLLMTKIYNKLPITVGKKVKYSNIDSNERSKKVGEILHLFELAKIIYKVTHTSANGLPLAAETNDKIFKNIFLDIGLMLSMQGLNYTDIDNMYDEELINIGNLSEQFVGQHLLYSLEAYRKPELYYWVREKANSSSEVDFIISQRGKVIPIEVKAGKTGSLKSLHKFINDKKIDFAIRINGNIPVIENITNKLTTGEIISFQLFSIPFYLVFRLRDLIR